MPRMLLSRVDCCALHEACWCLHARINSRSRVRSWGIFPFLIKAKTYLPARLTTLLPGEVKVTPRSKLHTAYSIQQDQDLRVDAEAVPMDGLYETAAIDSFVIRVESRCLR